MTKKSFSKQFSKHFQTLHKRFEPMLETDDMIFLGALSAICSDALVFSTHRMTGGDIEETRNRVAAEVNISLNTLHKI